MRKLSIKGKSIYSWIVLCLLAGVGLSLGLVLVMVFQIFWGDSSYLKKTAILAKINEETAIYYADEENRIGSFFEAGHRKYVQIDEVPENMINALIASEDKYFYSHWGVNPIAIGKAFVEGITSGHFRGGSTLTQQTVKNLLDKREYSIKRKYKEAIAAFQLERMYSKRQILEFYLNQFHVASNGNGIGIAAKYYFNKEVKDLNLVECAFIAGSVKGPSKYNPFIKYTNEDRDKAIYFANDRKNYVLDRMLEQGWINKEEYEQAKEEPVPFSKGKFSTKEVALVSLIKSQINKKEILDAIGLEDISELNNAGLQIYTTIDEKLQEQAQLSMRRNLSRLETILNGFNPEPAEEFKALRDLDLNEFYYGKVYQIDKTKGKQSISIDFGGLPKGVIALDALTRYAKLMDIAVPIGWEKRLEELLSKVKLGDILFVEVKEYDPKTFKAVLELHKAPKVSGGVISLDKGDVTSVVSGFYSEGYNRAAVATRQPGSIFKSVVFFAALQLGWSITDLLDNERRVFTYQNQFYYPRPDHPSPYKNTSMLWAGIKSENLASVYLTSRLTDQLNFKQFQAVLGALKLLPKSGESVRDYHYRVAKSTGVQLDNEGLKEYHLQNSISDISPDLMFSQNQDLLSRLSKMWWGKGYVDELKRLFATNPSEDSISKSEVYLRVDLVKNNYLRHLKVAEQLKEDWNTLKEVSGEDSSSLFENPDYAKILSRFRVLPGRSKKPVLGYFYPIEDEVMSQSKIKKIAGSIMGHKQYIEFPKLPGRALNQMDVDSIWGEGSLFSSKVEIDLSQVKIEGYLSVGILSKIKKRLEERYAATISLNTSYDLAKYFQHHDFRIAVGLEYLVKLCKLMGVYSPVEPVLSFPLGSNVVTLAEIAKIYQTFIDGKTYTFYKQGPANQLNYIKRIEDRDGNVLFAPVREEHQLVKSEFAEQMGQILKKVVTHGTGRRARSELHLNPDDTLKKAIRIPSYGKTGTTNDYVNASYAGFLPYPTKKHAQLDPLQSHVIATYVGYDDNIQMRKAGYKVTGSQGALPVWTDFAKGIIEATNYRDFFDVLNLKDIYAGQWSEVQPKHTHAAKIDLARGLLLRTAQDSDVETFSTTNYDVTGEEFEDEFSLEAVNTSIVYFPRGGELGSYRQVSPFAEKEEEGVLVQNVEFSSEVEQDASSRFLIDNDLVSSVPSQDGKKKQDSEALFEEDDSEDGVQKESPRYNSEDLW